MAEQAERTAGAFAEAIAAGGASAATRSEPDVHLFAMRLLGERYAVEARLVTEVVRIGPLTRLPYAPLFLPGVFTHRGEVLAVLDLNQMLGKAPIPISASTRAVLAQYGTLKVALVTEAIEGLVVVPAKDVEPSPASSSGAAEFLSGVGRDAKGVIAILEMKKVLEAAKARSGGAAA